MSKHRRQDKVFGSINYGKCLLLEGGSLRFPSGLRCKIGDAGFGEHNIMDVRFSYQFATVVGIARVHELLNFDCYVNSFRSLDGCSISA